MPRHAPASGSADPLDLHGVIPPTITAFHDDESLDEAATAAHAEFVVEHGAHAVFPLGTNGEFPLLSAAERERVVEVVSTAVGDDVPVIAGVGAPGTRETIRHAERAAAAGADGLVVVTPYYYPMDDEAAIDHYRRVADAVDRPVYVYHIPPLTGTYLSTAAMAEIADIDGVAGLKDTSGDVPWLGQVRSDNPDLTVLAGHNALLYAGLELGCAGVVSSVSNAFPELVVDLYEAFDDGDEDRAQELQETVRDVVNAFDRGPYMAGVKTALAERDVDFDPGPLRDPLRTMDDAETAALVEDLASIGLL
ncbi:dihydrodipicolinate synthase protein [Halorhabdus tiamatea SARL4B]|uniref:2-dehydro-3-deoxyphosphogluconate aldolase n=2 Tax=Halorhabdus tiamatea SARL4B TaxID=1033806 RepID=F7PKW4_9EURY|nr:dihydrodipicolinate synthase family protein [Halorhabdus tiamatea]ERJ06139.1 dihydrodipicolinate synthase protein [Halorhabdus tiamatea SARL4B]CCQ34083.1 2-dehydro-3-deoxyphosphogluconate aldolase [Halorhabdus tiamatea SARL4B]